MSGLKADSSSDAADREAKELRPVISEIEGLAISRPLVADRFEILTRLYTVLAVRLANGKKCAEALEAVEKASVISPENDEVKSLKKQLAEIMESIQKRVGELSKVLSSNPTAQLTAEGVSMKEQARLGLELAKKFKSSERAAQLAAAAAEAKARRFWLALGLPEGVNVQTEAARLNSAIRQIISKEPKNSLEIRSHWNALVGKDSTLVSIDEEKVIPFLAHLCFGVSWQAAEPKVADSEPPDDLTQLRLAEGSTADKRVPTWQWFLSRQHTIVRRVCVVGAAFLLALGAVQTPGLIHRLEMEKLYGPAIAFDADYPSTPANEAWIAFRKARPYPYQAICAKTLQDGSCVVIISVPPPGLSKSDFDSLLDSIFDGEITSKQRLRWRLGLDGWLEDVVIVLPAEQERTGDPMNNAVFRDRIAMLQLALFGTTYGGDVDNLDAGAPKTRPGAAANLQLTARQLRAWLEDSTFQWFPLTEDAATGKDWAQISAESPTQTLRSGDGSIIMLTFPTRLLQQAKGHPEMLTSLRVPFREFAVASDGVIGGIWGKSGETAILGRVRLRPYAVVPPLRYETFSLLAAQSSEQLNQSY